jgi:hypothetical protein
MGHKAATPAKRAETREAKTPDPADAKKKD